MCLAPYGSSHTQRDSGACPRNLWRRGTQGTSTAYSRGTCVIPTPQSAYALSPGLSRLRLMLSLRDHSATHHLQRIVMVVEMSSFARPKTSLQRLQDLLELALFPQSHTHTQLFHSFPNPKASQLFLR